MPLTKITLIGASGALGRAVLSSLLSTPTLSMTIIARASSKSTFPSTVQVITVSDAFTTAELTPALHGQDAVIVTVAGTNDALQIRVADAAARAGVKRFIPADFGSCDSASARALELMPLYGAKKKVRDHLIALAEKKQEEEGQGGGFSWTALITGHFFDYLNHGLLQVWPAKRFARVFDGGDIPFSATRLETVGNAVVRVLQRENETRNKLLYVQSFRFTQNQLLKVLENVTGQDWEVERTGSGQFIDQTRRRIDADPADKDAREDLVGVVGIVDGDWEGKGEAFANGLLGLEEESLEDAVREALKKE